MATVDDGLNGAHGAPDGRRVEQLAAENARLREEMGRLRAEWGELARLREAVARLEREKAEIAAERDLCVKSLNYLTRKDFTFTAEEIADMDKNGVEFNEEFIRELEHDLRKLEGPDGPAS